MNFFVKTALLILCVLHSSSAFACMEAPRLSDRLNNSDLIFQGHLVRYETTSEAIPEDPNKIFFNVIEVYTVDRNWKGTTKEQEVKILPIRPPSRNGELPSIPANSEEKIITLRSVTMKQDFYESLSECPNSFDLTWGNRIRLFFRFPLAVFQ